MKRPNLRHRRSRSLLFLLALALPLTAANSLAFPEKSVAAEDNSPLAKEGYEATAYAEAARSGQRVEILDRREETVEVFANPDGTTTRRAHATPVWSKLEGTWRKTDPTLTKRPDGTVAPLSPTFAITFSGGGNSPLATMDRQGKKLSLTWPSALPEPVLEQNTALYRSVLPGVDLKVIAEVDGFAEHLVIHSAEAAANPALKSITFGVKAEGVTLDEDAGDNLIARDPAGNVVFSAPRPKMWEQPAAAEAEPAPTAKTAAFTSFSSVAAEEQDPQPQTAPVGADVTGSTLTLTPDPALLASADQFPLIVDPAFTGGYRERWAVVYSATPSDSYVNGSGWNSDRPADEPRIGFNGTGRTRSFFAMNTTGLEGATILDATFAVEQTHSWGCSASAAGPTELWATDPINTAPTWNSQNTSSFWNTLLDADSFAHGNPTYCPGVQGHDFRSAALKNYVQQTASSKLGYLTLGLRADSGYEGRVDSFKRLRNNPVLEVTYNYLPTVDTSAAFEGTWAPGGEDNKQVACGGVIGNNGLALTAKVTDKDGGNVGAYFTVRNANNAVVSFGPNPSLSTVASGKTASVTMPHSQLANGKYSWTVQAKDQEGTASAVTTACSFTVDRIGPDKAVTVRTLDGKDPASDTDVVKFPARHAAQLKLSHTASDLAGFCYAMDRELAVSSSRCYRGTWVDAAADNSATITVTPTGSPASKLTVIAYDDAGNHSPVDGTLDRVSLKTTPYDFVYSPGTGPGSGGYRHDVAGDLNGDGYADLITTSQPARLFLYPGNGTGRFAGAGQQIGDGGWSAALIAHRGDYANFTDPSLPPDGYEDYIVRLPDNKLWLYPNNGLGVPWVHTRQELVHPYDGDWSRLRQVIASGNIDGKPGNDLVTIECIDAPCSNSKLWLYSGRQIADGTPDQNTPFDLVNRAQINSSGWTHYTNVALGDVTGDGVPDLVGRNPNMGQLLLFAGKPTDGAYLLHPYQVYGTSGWDSANRPRLTSPGNIHGTVKTLTDEDDGHTITYRQFQPTPGEETGGIWATTPADNRTITYVDDAGTTKTTTCPNGCLLFYPGWTADSPNRLPKLVGTSAWATTVINIY
ncbi:FG-GAP repeat domain-containing protein [Streptomyces purpureus]|uniref:Uncharacterized protein n=1 Tax=Streptomyces purpureus TaxID=1951 RepID=A0A918HIE8_9ACTN|nr:VCBS repeat-containing protein [Streptomyces purpureus]GGT61059.1 hypothetical protein GCM10014713_62980 [Streptomyces purpureus]